jgi:predicted type IV restriction endonuclease
MTAHSAPRDRIDLRISPVTAESLRKFAGILIEMAEALEKSA